MLNLIGFGSQLRDVNGRGFIFEISKEDIASDPSYFLYLNHRGYFIIQKRDASAGTYTYFAGRGVTTTKTAAWTGRAALTYVDFDSIFFNP